VQIGHLLHRRVEQLFIKTDGVTQLGQVELAIAVEVHMPVTCLRQVNDLRRQFPVERDAMQHAAISLCNPSTLVTDQGFADVQLLCKRRVEVMLRPVASVTATPRR